MIMEWYLWLLLAIVIVVGGAIKLTVLSKWMEHRKAREAQIPEDV
jgi:hypothetical protein